MQCRLGMFVASRECNFSRLGSADERSLCVVKVVHYRNQPSLRTPEADLLPNSVISDDKLGVVSLWEGSVRGL